MHNDEIRKNLCEHSFINVLDLDSHTLYPAYGLFQKANVGDFIENIDKNESLNYQGYVKRRVFRNLYCKHHLIIEISNKQH